MNIKNQTTLASKDLQNPMMKTAAEILKDAFFPLDS